MPWEQSSPIYQKTQFVSEYLRDTISFTELCDRYGISRKTGYKVSLIGIKPTIKCVSHQTCEHVGNSPILVRDRRKISC